MAGSQYTALPQWAAGREDQRIQRPSRTAGRAGDRRRARKAVEHSARMIKLIRRQMLRGETPFLHVMCDNVGAHALYQPMGFRDYKESVVRVVSRC
jgi:hypothetical protein